MSIHNFSNGGSLPYRSAADIKTDEIRTLVEKNPSISVLSLIGHEMCKALLTRTEDEQALRIINDLMVVLSISQQQSNEVRAMANKVKSLLNIRDEL